MKIHHDAGQYSSRPSQVKWTNQCMAQTVETLIRENIHGIFDERDAEKRRAKIASLWAADGVFIAPEARYEGHSGIERAAAGFMEMFPGFTFTDRGEVQAYNGVGRLAWGYGPPGAEAVVTGTDVLVMKGDKIAAVYVFQDAPKKDVAASSPPR